MGTRLGMLFKGQIVSAEYADAIKTALDSGFSLQVNVRSPRNPELVCSAMIEASTDAPDKYLLMTPQDVKFLSWGELSLALLTELPPP